MGTIQGSSAASAAAIVAAMSGSPARANPRTAAYPREELVADADREHVIDELREHMLAGRLTAAELEERLGAAHRARTRADLDAVRIGLPLGLP
jgi:hypothetical protein